VWDKEERWRALPKITAFHEMNISKGIREPTITACRYTAAPRRVSQMLSRKRDVYVNFIFIYIYMIHIITYIYKYNKYM
jgi:hypothetical protein